MERVITGLEIDENIDLHITSWKIQPIVWALIGLFLLAGLAGFFGSGPLSTIKVQSERSAIEFERFHRQGLILPLTITTRDKDLFLALPLDFLSKCRMETMVPLPIRSYNQDGYMYYRFSGSTCILFLRPEAYGRQTVNARINNQYFHFSMLIYP